MRILACDTSGASVSVAIWQDNVVIVERTLNVGLIHSKTFMPLVAQVIQESGCQLADIDLYAVTTGPGSFTGIRIGVSAVKAMAYAQKKKMVGLTTLDVLAFPYRICQDHLVCPMLDARNHRTYAGAWLGQEQVLPIENQPIVTFMKKVHDLAVSDPSIRGVVLVTRLPLDAGSQDLQSITAVHRAPSALCLPMAGALAELAAHVHDIGQEKQPEQVKATYFVRSGAERKHDGH